MDCCVYTSPLGVIHLQSDGNALTALRFADSRIPSLATHNQVFRDVCRWLDVYFGGADPGFLPPLSPIGTEFQRLVWRELLTIPFGSTVSYGDMAHRIGCRSAQAVGQAVGHNPIAIIIPCHRVVGSDGNLTGYAYGIERKNQLLTLESRVVESCPPPTVQRKDN